jgi:hypothetical protein
MIFWLSLGRQILVIIILVDWCKLTTAGIWGWRGPHKISSALMSCSCQTSCTVSLLNFCSPPTPVDCHFLHRRLIIIHNSFLVCVPDLWLHLNGRWEEEQLPGKRLHAQCNIDPDDNNMHDKQEGRMGQHQQLFCTIFVVTWRSCEVVGAKTRGGQWAEETTLSSPAFYLLVGLNN